MRKWNIKLRKVLMSFESESSPDRMHEVRRGADGKIYCTCMGWRFHRSCWHLDVFFARSKAKKAA